MIPLLVLEINGKEQCNPVKNTIKYINTSCREIYRDNLKHVMFELRNSTKFSTSKKVF